MSSFDPAMGLGFWAHLSTWWSLTTSQESGSEEAVMACREPNTTKTLAVSVRFEPSRLSPTCVAQAYEQVVPITHRTTPSTAPTGQAGREVTRQRVGRRAAS